MVTEAGSFERSFTVLFADKWNIWVSRVALVVKNPPVEAGAAGDAGSFPESGRSPRIGNGNPLQSSCSENFVDTGATGLQPMGPQSDMTERLTIHTYTE